MRKLIPIVLGLLLAGCAGGEQLSNCKGPIVALNPTQWNPSPAFLHAFASQEGAR